MVCERRISVQGMVWNIVSYEDSLFVGMLINASYKIAWNYSNENNHACDDQSLEYTHLRLKNAQKQGNSIMRIDMPSMQTEDWSTDYATDQRGFGVEMTQAAMNSLSMTKNGNLLLCLATENKLKEYTKEGVLVRTISVDLNSNPEYGITCSYHPIHHSKETCNISQAFHLMNDKFVVLTKQSNICILNNGGQVITKQIKQNQQPTPCVSCIFVDQNDSIFVVNQQTDQLTLLNSSLDPVKVILPQLSSYSRYVSELFVDQKDGKIYFNDTLQRKSHHHAVLDIIKIIFIRCMMIASDVWDKLLCYLPSIAAWQLLFLSISSPFPLSEREIWWLGELAILCRWRGDSGKTETVEKLKSSTRLSGSWWNICNTEVWSYVYILVKLNINKTVHRTQFLEFRESAQIKILGVTIIENLSVSDQVRDHVRSLRSRSTLWECCELMDLTVTQCKPYITQSSCPNCCMRRPPGMDSPAKKTVIESIHSWRNHQNPYSLLRIIPHSHRCVKNLMTKCLKKSVWTSIMCCIACCRLLMSRATIFVVELIHSSYQQNAKLSYRTITFLNEFSIKIHINGKIAFINSVLI